MVAGHERGTKVHRLGNKRVIVFPCPICGQRPQITKLDQETWDERVIRTVDVVYCKRCDTWPVDDAGGFQTIKQWNDRGKYSFELLCKTKELRTQLRRLTYGSGTPKFK